MALLGCFGMLIFECSRRRVQVVEQMHVSNKNRMAEHAIHLQTPILEFVGPGLTEVTFKMNFNQQWNADPFISLLLLRMYCRSGMVAPLLVGNRPITLGFNLWVVTQVGEEHKFWTRHGTLQGAAVDVNLKEYKLLV
jgi:hypothetical protein